MFTFRIFIVGAIVLIVFAIIASASATKMLFSTDEFTWAWAALLSFFVDLLITYDWPLVGGTRQPR